MFKFFSTLFYTIFIAFVVGTAGLLIGTMLPIPGNIEIKIVKSGSMEPTIPTGSLVLVKPAPIYTKGDIITFGKDTKTDIPTTHRIIAVNDDGTFTTKGDANEEEDQQTAARRDVIGKVLISVPGAGYVLAFARTKVGFVLLIGIPAGLVILEELLTITRETQKWYRDRRRRRDGDGGGSALDDDTLDLRMHLKRVYTKRYAMDEIKIAMFVEPHWYEAKWWRRRLGLDTDAYGTSTSLTVGLVFFTMVFAGQNGGTIAYFQDLERSVGNVLQAGAWNLEDVPVDIVQVALTEDDGAVLGASQTTTDASSSPETVEEELPPAEEESQTTDSEEEPPAPPPLAPESEEPVAVEEAQDSAPIGDDTPPVDTPAEPETPSLEPESIAADVVVQEAIEN